jgi:ketosteroid isomerase-like protein
MNPPSSDPPAGGYLDVLDSFYAAEQRYVDAGGAPAGVDFGEVAAHLHPDVVARQGPSVPFPGEWHGAAALQEFFTIFTDTWSSLDLSEISTFVGDTGIAIEMRMQATARATGKHLDTRVAHVMTFEDGLIREINVFYRDPVGVMDVTLP